MIELGRTKQRKTYRFKEWLSSWAERYETGEYLITALLNPSKFPSGGLIFSVSSNESVKMSIRGERYKELLKAMGFKKGKDRLGIRLLFRIRQDEDGIVYGVEVEEADESVGYVVESWGWRFTQNASEEVEDLDF